MLIWASLDLAVESILGQYNCPFLLTHGLLSLIIFLDVVPNFAVDTEFTISGGAGSLSLLCQSVVEGTPDKNLTPGFIAAIAVV